MTKAVRFLKNWMLPLAILTGVSTFLLIHSVTFLQPYEAGFSKFAANIQPILVSIMLFLQFNVVPPTDMKLHKWYFTLIALQSVLFIVLAVIATFLKLSNFRILIECAMLCFICPTAAAAGVITAKLGGNVSEVITYTVIINAVASLLIPFMIPLVHHTQDLSFMDSFAAIVRRVFSILLLPCAAAWTIRYTLPKLQKLLARYVNLAFYFWGVSLTFALFLAAKALIYSNLPFYITLLIGAVSLICCLLQFKVGRMSAKRYGKEHAITAGQAMGQKNTGFFIWLCYSYMTPVTSIAGGFYSIWHNLVNTYELYKSRH